MFNVLVTKKAPSWSFFARPRVPVNLCAKYGRTSPSLRCFAQDSKIRRNSWRSPFIAPAVLAVGFAAAVVLYPVHSAYADASSESSTGKKIRLAEVKEHGRDSEQKWVFKGIRVYDITDWIPGHPGGEVILRAVGGTIDKYWDIFSIHKKQDVYDILEEYYIGDLDPSDLVNGKVPSDDIDDPSKRTQNATRLSLSAARSPATLKPLKKA